MQLKLSRAHRPVQVLIGVSQTLSLPLTPKEFPFEKKLESADASSSPSLDAAVFVYALNLKIVHMCCYYIT